MAIWTSPKTWSSGETLTAANFNTHIRDNESFLFGQRLRKTADELVNNSAALQDDNDLTFAVAASEVWSFSLFLMYTSNTTADFKLAIGEPSGATTRWTTLADSAGTAVITGPSVGGDAAAVTIQYGAADDPILINGVCANSTNAGNLTLRWAQGTATVVDTIVRANSFLVAHRIA
jgi:hypothetical protein